MDRKYAFSVNKKSPVPIYKQIVRGILQKLSEGTLKPGMSLPPERELAANLSVSRGTVQKAYEELYHKNILETRQGAGTFISQQQPKANNTPQDPLDAVISSMLEKGYTNFEIKSIFNDKLARRNGNQTGVAVVDCNPESLGIIERQLLTEKGMKITGFPLNETLTATYPEQLFGGFDLILTTPAHYDELSNLLPKDKLIKISVAPDRKTVVSLASLSAEADSVGILTASSRFADIIRDSLRTFGIDVPDGNILTEANTSPESFKKLASGSSVLVIPPLSELKSLSALDGELFDFIETGGKAVVFNYTIELGSLLHVEEMLKLCKR